MLTLERLRSQVKSTEELRSIARAMKALAAVRIRQSRAAVDSLERYAAAVESGLQVALRNRPRGMRLAEDDALSGTGAIVFGSDLGLAGRFNIRIADFAIEHLAEVEPDENGRALLAVGTRVAGELRGHTRVMVRPFEAPSSIAAVTATVQNLLVAIEEIRRERRLGRILLFYNHYHSGTTFRPHMIHLLPMNLAWLRGLEARPWPSQALPRFRAPWEHLFRDLVREHLFVSLYAAAAESQAAENASRLASMEAAERRIDERLEAVRGRLNQQRKEQITEELLDLLAGYVAVQEQPKVADSREKEGMNR